LAPTQAQSGHIEDVRKQASLFLRLQPAFTISKTGRQLNVFKSADDDKHAFDGLGKAGYRSNRTLSEGALVKRRHAIGSLYPELVLS
jgi:hypothetical protein